jgi:Heparinase II/III-like protein
MRLPLLACAFLSLATAAFPAPDMPPHPRLLATAADFERIRSSITQPGPLQDAFHVLLTAGEREYPAPPLERVVIGRRMLATSRDALRRILNFSILHHLTGDPKWAPRAEQEMLALAAFPDWNPSHFLDTAEAATGVAIGYDWLYDSLSPDTRRTLREALVKHALIPGDTGELGWWRNRNVVNNWTQVCEAGLALAALTVAESHPELSARTLDRARRDVPAIFAAYEPSGAYVEGPMYWDYGTNYHILLIEALRTATGSAGDLATNPAFLQSAAVVNQLTAPSGEFFNFGDCSLHRWFFPAMYWFARETQNPAVAANEPAFLRNLRDNPRKLPSRFLALSLLWIPPGPAPAPVSPPAAWKTDGPNPIAVFRQGAGPGSLYAAMKGGRARISHSHMDAGGFIFEAGGVRWAVDPGMPDYHDLEKVGVQLFGKDRWSVYVLGPNSHSIPLLDDRAPDEEATATLTAFDAKTQSASFDLGPLHPGRVEKLHRDLRITSADTISIRDTVGGAQPGARYRFSWMTRATVETDATGATLRQDGKTLRLDVSADTAFEVVDEDASRPPAAYDAPQPGLRRVSVLFTVAQPEHTLSVTARLLVTSPAP